MARVDYFNDQAPRRRTASCPRSRRSRSTRPGRSCLSTPGGGVDVRESALAAAVREMKEETGFDVEVTGLIGIYTNSDHVMAYDDGEVRQQFSICFRARITGGKIRTSSESKEVAP
ncbi:NUDIX hydrolase [Streptomyces sp. NPDC001902]